MSYFWTIERENSLIALVSQRLSFSKIAAQLGLTKNACIGKAHRAGLLHLRPPRPKTFDERMAALQIFPPKGGCVFPQADGPDYDFCGETAVPDRAYCPAHMERCVTLVPDPLGDVV